MNVRLEWYEMTEAAIVGVMRNISCLKDGRGTNSRAPWEAHIEGACAEMAYAKATKTYWSHSVNTFRSEPDVGNVQVRSTQNPNYGLACTDRDKDSDIFVLVVGRAPNYEIVGWATGAEVKNGGSRNGNLYILSQEMLMPMYMIAP